MPITVDDLVVEVLEELALPIDGTGQITKTLAARFMSDAQTEFNDLTLILKVRENVVAIADQIEYDLPDNFKTNLYRIEYNFVALTKENKDFLDLFDERWRSSVQQSAVASIPRYFVNQLEEEGKFLIYPPPVVGGDSVTLLSGDGGLPQAVTLDGSSVSLIDADGGLVQTLAVGDVVIDLMSLLGGLPITIVSGVDNFTLEYIKEPAALKLENGNIEPQLELYKKALKAFTKTECYLTENFFNEARATVQKSIFNAEVLRAKRNIERARPKHPKSMRPVFNRAGLGRKENFVTA